jgi:ribonuclease BN (tRNA processing enzyme)
MTIETGGRYLILDAGSGILTMDQNVTSGVGSSPTDHKPSVNILLSHLHIDHIVGLALYSPVWDKHQNVHIFTCTRDERPRKEQVFGLFKPPYWPVDATKAAHAQCVQISSMVPFNVGGLDITPFNACHPDRTMSFHITDGHRTVVHLLDSEVALESPEDYNQMMRFCDGADLVVFDAAYSPEDYPTKVGWGHSTVLEGVKLARECRPKRMMFSHFSQDYDDTELDSWQRFFDDSTQYLFCGDGLEIVL